MKTLPKYKVIWSTEHACDLLSYADTKREAEEMGKDWLAEANVMSAEDDPEFDADWSPNSYEVYKLTEEEAKEVARDDFLNRFKSALNDKIAECWEEFDQDHAGAKLVCERKIKAIAAQEARDYFDGWRNIILTPSPKADDFESESSTWVGHDGRP